MKSLAFAALPEGCFDGMGGRRVRRAQFEVRSSLPLSAACVVANGVRETLSSLLGAHVAMRLFEPSIPAPDAWHAILRSARLYRIRGRIADAALVLRPPDAVALAATLFGEAYAAGGTADRTLSRIEGDVLDRMVGALAANLGAVCGIREAHAVERVASICGFVTYFELLIEEPVAARIGIALSRDPSPEAGASLEAGHLARVKLTTVASLDAGTSDVAALARLAVGTIVPIAPREFHRCTLAAHGRRLSRGSCGVRNGRYAFSIDAIREAM
jgi:Type III flagellar switch regulator (C-ring) FliN C-term